MAIGPIPRPKIISARTSHKMFNIYEEIPSRCGVQFWHIGNSGATVFFATSKRSSENIPPIRDGPEHKLDSCEPEQADERLALQLPSYAQKEDRDRKMRGKGMPWLRTLG